MLPLFIKLKNRQTSPCVYIVSYRDGMEGRTPLVVKRRVSITGVDQSLRQIRIHTKVFLCELSKYGIVP